MAPRAAEALAALARAGGLAGCAALAAAGGLAGCAGGDGSDQVSRSPSPTVAPGPTPATEPATPTAAPSPPALPDSCAELVSVVDVTAALGRPLAGRTTYLYAGPLLDAGRTGRVTCGFGVVAGRPPAVAVSLIGYRDEATAAERVQLTAGAAQERGERVVRQGVGEYDGFLLADPAEDASLVLAVGRRTLVVTLRRGIVPVTATRSALGGVAAAVLRMAGAGAGPA